MIEDFLRRLVSAGLNADLREARDGLWLAQYLVTTVGADATQQEAAPRRSRARPASAGSSGGRSPSAAPGSGEIDGHPGAALHAAGSGNGGRTVKGMQVRSPAVPALRHQLRLTRALRPLKRRVASRTTYEFDEAATAEQAAGQTFWPPVFRPARVRWLDLELVVDQSSSMVVWRRTIAELKTLLERLAAFRAVHESFVDSAAEQALVIRDRAGHRREPRKPDAAERARVVLVITDAIGGAWRDGRMDELLRSWGMAAPIAVVTVLPQRMWRGSGLRVALGQLRNAADTVSGELAARPAWAASTEGPVPIAVMELAPRWFRPWADVLSGTQEWQRSALLVPPDDAASPDVGRTRVALPVTGSATRLVAQFRASASPTAFHLACYLSATGLNLPVMRLVQRVMLPQSETIHLAEVFLSGLLQAEPISNDIDGEITPYDFLPGVRDELNRYLTRDDMLDIVRETSRFIAERFGQSLDFAALLADPEGAPIPILEGSGVSTLAYVSIGVLAKLGGRYQILADRLAVPARAEQPTTLPADTPVPRSKPAILESASARAPRLYFFLSYARTPKRDPSDKTDPDRWVYKLFKDLCDEILMMTDLNPDEVGFMDREIKLGSGWSTDLVSALQSCRVFVPLYSTRYFESDTCGKEWFAFMQRWATYSALNDPVGPIIPALWTRLDRDRIPDVARSFQYDHADLGVRYAAEGFYGIMKLRNYRADYQRAVHRLAQHIVDVASSVPESSATPIEQRALLVRDFESLPSAFGPTSARRTTDGQLCICVLAPDITVLPPERTPDYYGESPTAWCPYLPHSSRPIAQFASVLTENSLDIEPLFDQIGNLMRQATSTSSNLPPTLVIIDPYISLMPQYQEQLRAVDQLGEPWVSIMLPWNTEDEGLAAAKSAIQDQLRLLLPRKLDSVPRRFRQAADGISTFTEFAALLPEMSMTMLKRYRKGAPAYPPASPSFSPPRLRQAPPGATS